MPRLDTLDPEPPYQTPAPVVLTRPALRYHGGKWKLAPWLISQFPPHRIYVEAFAGAASVLLQKPRSHGEVYNDLDEDVVNVFRVLRDPAKAQELERRIRLTPFARQEFRWAYTESESDVDSAHKMIIRAFMGFGSASMTRRHYTGFRSNANRSGTNPSHDWASWPAQIQTFTERLKGVVIENKDAAEVMLQHDSAETLHYVDPPYVQSTRTSLKNRNGNVGHYYRHDLADDQHRELLEVLRSLKGMVIVSSYDCALYREGLASWQRRERKHMADGARQRLEIIWLNAATISAQRQTPLSFESK